jgi:hypothetical protein
MLIVFNAVVLVIQSAPALDSPRGNDGYFRAWEDWALLMIFIIFTFEIFARIVVTGLIFDPKMTLTAVPGVLEPRVVSQPQMLLSRYQSFRRHINRSPSPVQDGLHRSNSMVRPSAIAHRQIRAQQQWRSENIKQRQAEERNRQEATRSGLPAGAQPRQSKPRSRGALFEELPFEVAMKRQMSMAATGRPFLRHSWQ